MALEALWPERYRRQTVFPLRLPEPAGPVFSPEWNATTAEVHAAYRQIGRAWAAVHTLVHNAPDPLSRRQAEASAALALWLRQTVSCCNCRGFFSQLLNEVGLPPLGSVSKLEHARWWWRTHNAVSEHAEGRSFLFSLVVVVTRREINFILVSLSFLPCFQTLSLTLMNLFFPFSIQ